MGNPDVLQLHSNLECYLTPDFIIHAIKFGRFIVLNPHHYLQANYENNKNHLRPSLPSSARIEKSRDRKDVSFLKNMFLGYDQRIRPYNNRE